MKITEQDLKEIMGLVEQADAFKPLADKVTYLLTNTFGPNLKDLIATASMALCDVHADMFDYYINRNFSREEAILLTLDTKTALQRAGENLGKTKKKD